MSLAQQMIDAVNAKATQQLAAIEDHLGQIEEAETLAATLRSYGLSAARAHGFPRSGSIPGVITYVAVLHDTTEAITQALADADLRLAHFMATPDGEYTDIHLAGLDTYLVTDAEVGQELFAQRERINAREPAHA
jgi:hypothetical protein